MKKIPKNKALFLLAISMFMIAVTFVVNRYVLINDFSHGAMIGMGIGLGILAIWRGDFKSETSK